MAESELKCTSHSFEFVNERDFCQLGVEKCETKDPVGKEECRKLDYFTLHAYRYTVLNYIGLLGLIYIASY